MPSRQPYQYNSTARALLGLVLLCGSHGLLAQGSSGNSLAASDEAPDFYRVELITFRHLGEGTVPQLNATTGDYSNIGEAGLLLPAGLDPEAPELAALPEPEDRSTAMNQAWQRLSNNARYQPEAYVSWIQPPLDRNRRREVRVHGEALLPEPVLPEVLELDENGEPLLPEPAVEDIAATEVETITLPEDSELADAMELYQYQMDGKASLTEGRFLQLWLDLEWRELADLSRIDHPDMDGLYYAIHPLLQQRVVEPGTIYYFDSPSLAVLARIEGIHLENEEAQPAAAMAPAAVSPQP